MQSDYLGKTGQVTFLQHIPSEAAPSLPLLSASSLSVQLKHIHHTLILSFSLCLLSFLYQGMKKAARSEVKKMGPLKVAHLNGLSVSRQPMHDEVKDEPERASNDERVGCFRNVGCVNDLLLVKQ